MAKSNGKTRYRSLSSLQPWEVDGLYFHKQFPDIKVEKLPREPKLAKVKAGAREVKTAAQDTVDTFKIQGVLTAIKALDTYDAAKPRVQRTKNDLRDRAINRLANGIDRGLRAKDKAANALDNLRYRRDVAADFITVAAGRAMMARVVGVQEVRPKKVKEPHVPLRQVLGKPPKAPKPPKPTRQPKPAQAHTEPRFTLPANPTGSQPEKTRSRRPGPRTAGAAAVALAALATSLAGARAEHESLAQEVAMPVFKPEVAPAAIPMRPASIMDSSLSSTWSAPRAEDRVVYNALPVPSINAVDYAARMEQAKADMRARQYAEYELARSQNRTSLPAPTSFLDTSTGSAEQAEIARLAAQAEAAAEIQRYQQERAALVGQLQPGQQIGTIRLVQTGETSEPGAPTGVNIVEHAVRVGMYDPSTIAGDVPTDREIDGGMKKALNHGAAIHVYGGNVPGVDTLQIAPTVIAMHHFTEVNDPAFPDETEAFRWPEKTTIADPENGIRGDILTMTVGDEMMLYEAVAEQLIDTTAEGRVEEAKYLFGTEAGYGAELLRLYNCAQSPEELASAAPGTTPEADKRYVVFFAPIGAVYLDYIDTIGQ